MQAFNFRVFAIIPFLVVSSVTSTKEKDSSLKVPEKCKNKSYCSIKPEGYENLEQKINAALPSFLIKEFADRDSMNDFIKDPFPEKNPDNCQYEIKKEQMYTYYHGKNNTKTEIIIQTDLFKQYVLTVNCLYDTIKTDSDLQCFKHLMKKPYDMKTYCKESYAKRSLYVYDEEKKNIDYKYFDVPACCSCQVNSIV